MLLQKQSNLKNLSITNNIWPNMYFLAESNQEKFTELVIITSNSYRKEKAAEQAFAQGANIGNIDVEIKKIYNSIPIEEFVEVLNDNILIIINVAKIDDSVINKVLNLISQIPEFKIGQRINLDVFIS